MSGDTEVKTQKWTKGSMAAAKQITRSSKLRMVAVGTILREEADKEFCEIISRETKDAEMEDLLRRAHLELGSEHGTVARPHCSCPLCSEIKALLTTLEKI